jgi:hypothetical protein
MTTQLRPLHEIDRAGRAALVRELGVVGALRFLRQFTTGQGDYTAERASFLGDETLEELFEQVEKVDQKRNA